MLQIARTVAAYRVIIPSVVRALHRHYKGLGSSVVPEELQLMMMNFSGVNFDMCMCIIHICAIQIISKII